MQMKTTKTIAEAFLVLWALTHSPLLAFFLLMLMIYDHAEQKKLQDQIEALMDIKEDPTDSVSQEALRRVRDMYHATPKRFEIYKGCTISDYHFYFEIMDPVGNVLEELFATMDEAKAHVDKIEPYMPKPIVKKSRVHNIRFVR